MIYSVEDILKHGKANTYIIHGNEADAECVLGFSFGYVQDGSHALPGRSNTQLATYI